MKHLYVSWRDPSQRDWHVVGRLSQGDDIFRFDYTRGALRAFEHGSFRPFPSFPDLDVTYESPRLFPFFSNRLLPKGRPDYAEFIQWISPRHQEEDPIALLGASGGRRQTDSDTLQLFPLPERDPQGYYRLHFFSHGSRHMPEASVERILRLKRGERLLIGRDVQNPHDADALTLRTLDEAPHDFYFVGFMPRYLAKELSSMLENDADAKVQVIRVNPPPAPVQFRLLCCLFFRGEAQLFQGEDYQPITQSPQNDELLGRSSRLRVRG
jgi:hypothetical protein